MDTSLEDPQPLRCGSRLKFDFGAPVSRFRRSLKPPICHYTLEYRLSAIFQRDSCAVSVASTIKRATMGF